MFFFLAVTDDTRSLGKRRCRLFSCCGLSGAEAEVVCVSRKFILFFFPLFRFGKRYFVTCPGCGAVYELAPGEGKILEHNPDAEINPDKLIRVSRREQAMFCPGCGAKVQPGTSFCPYCGRRL